ncbi:MAG: hypothetical protein ACOY94_22890 [Bacillota bacterium]
MKMRFLAVAIVALVVGCSSPVPVTQVTTQPPAPLSDQDAILHGIAIGMAAEDARNLLSNPTLEESSEQGQYWWEGGMRGVAVFFKQGIVWRVDDQVGPSPRGLEIGDEAGRVEQLYGTPTKAIDGYMHYLTPSGTRMVIQVLDGRVVEMMVMNERVLDASPEQGREVQQEEPVLPFGPQDHVLAGIEACSPITDLRKDDRLLETLGSNDRKTSLEFMTSDKFLHIYPRDFTSFRVDFIVALGGAYETHRGVRVGDPFSRVKALYGVEKPGDSDVALDFKVNSRGRIERITLRCIRSGSPSSKDDPNNNQPTSVTFDALLVGVGRELVMKRGYQTFEYPLAEGARLLRNGKPIVPTELQSGMRVRVTVKDNAIVQLEDISTPESAP